VLELIVPVSLCVCVFTLAAV